MSLPEKFIAIDEEGFPLFGDIRVSDPKVCTEILNNLRYSENNAFMTTVADDDALVEAFDEPYVAQQVLKLPNGEWRILLPFGLEKVFKPADLGLDEWDRFHGLTDKSIPFVFSRAAQNEFFNLVDEFDDESITIDGETIEVESWLPDVDEVETSDRWTKIYRTENPKWELEQAAPALVDMLPRLKLPKSKVLVLGCGSGEDAAFFAQAGHVVTAVDFSEEAIARAKKKFGHLPNLEFIQQDIFKLGREHDNSYSLVFEHTCFCAINPAKRNDMVKLWRRVLIESGFLMGVFFTMEARRNTPFGATEWEIRERLKRGFHFVFWSRWQKSIERRNGKELYVYAQKKSLT